VIGQYVSHFGPDTIGVSGDLSELRKLTDGLGIYFEKSGVDADNYSVDHSAVVIVVDPDGRFHSLFGAPHEADNFAHDLPIIMSTR
jgi:protein SCO1/2